MVRIRAAFFLLLLCCVFKFVTAAEMSVEDDFTIYNEEMDVPSTFEYPDDKNPLSGKHLIVFTGLALEPYLKLERNSSGDIIGATGPSAEALRDISRSLNFTFEYYQDKDDKIPENVDDIGTTKPGKLSFFQNTKSDLMVGVLAFTDKRIKVIDFPCPTALNPLAVMIPKPSIQKIDHISAILLPFQIQVWIGLGISIVIGIASLYGICRWVAKIIKLSNSSAVVLSKDPTEPRGPVAKGKPNGRPKAGKLSKVPMVRKVVNKWQHCKMKKKDEGNAIKKSTKTIISPDISEYNRLEKVLAFFFGNIIVQGNIASRALSNNGKLGVQLLAAAWCLSCFVLVTAYSSVLISFLTAPDNIYTPLVNSVNDLPMKPEIRVTVDRSKFSDIVFAFAVDDPKSSSVFKYIGNQLKQHPEQRCISQNQCIEQVRQGSSVYIFNDVIILNAIGEDWKKTGKCDFAVAKEKFLQTLITAFALPKNSPYTKYFTRQLMRMEAAGLLRGFQTSFAADPYHCLNKIKKEMTNKKRNTTEKKPLTLTGLSGAFLLLVVGYALAILIFLLEIIYSRFKNRHIRHQRVGVVAPFVVKSTAELIIKSIDEKKGEKDDEVEVVELK